MSKTFADLGVSKAVAEALAKRGIESPFPVQQLVIEDVLDGRDVLVQSPTGSGKTLAFGVPLVDRIAADSRRPAALVLAPTRELARQIVDELETIARARALKVEVVYGGVGIEPQIRKAPKAHILVATPGRLEDLIQRRALTLANIRTLVLDEADRMLDMGFKPAVDRIVAHDPEAAARRSSSPQPSRVPPASSPRPTPTTPRRHVHAPKPEGGRAAISHRFVESPSQARQGRPARRRARRPRPRAGRSSSSAPSAAPTGWSRSSEPATSTRSRCTATSPSPSARRRSPASSAARSTVLVATDVAARGIDVADITHVINFDAPEDGDAYTHRVGRTGRAGATGSGVSFVLADQVHDMRRLVGGLGLAGEFDARDGAGSAPPPRDSGSRTAAAATAAAPAATANGGSRNQNGSHRANATRPATTGRRRIDASQAPPAPPQAGRD